MANNNLLRRCLFEWIFKNIYTKKAKSIKPIALDEFSKSFEIVMVWRTLTLAAPRARTTVCETITFTFYFTTTHYPYLLQVKVDFRVHMLLVRKWSVVSSWCWGKCMWLRERDNYGFTSCDFFLNYLGICHVVGT